VAKLQCKSRIREVAEDGADEAGVQEIRMPIVPNRLLGRRAMDASKANPRRYRRLINSESYSGKYARLYQLVTLIIPQTVSPRPTAKKPRYSDVAGGQHKVGPSIFIMSFFQLACVTPERRIHAVAV
jgi:hypothetical protein